MRSLVTITLASLALAAVPASARIAGGGPTTTDCYTEWENVTATGLAGNNPIVDCADGDPNCDVDGQADGACTFNVSSCILQRDITGCTPPPLKKLTITKKVLKVGGIVTSALVPPPATSETQICGTAGTIRLPLRKGNTKPSKKFRIRAVAISTAKGASKKDVDVLILKCEPPLAGCPANPAGGPNEFKFVIQQESTDLDNGWTGQSHNQPMVFGTPLRICLKDCNASGTPACTQADGTASVNGRTFGGPLPLIAAQVKVCVVNRLGVLNDANNKVSDGIVNFATGVMSMTVNLLSEVHLGELCPNCSGQEIGTQGKCQSGANAGASCVTDGIVTVPGQGTFTVSSNCPPSTTLAGTLTIPLALTTGVSRLDGPKPCGESSDHSCGSEGPCDLTTCTCASIDSNGNCVTSTGGIAQYCCHSNPNKSCHPTAAGEVGFIERVGSPKVPSPAAPDPTFPKCGTNTVLAATFCEAATNSSVINGVTGLPGPGAGLFPIRWQVKSTGDSDCP